MVPLATALHTSVLSHTIHLTPLVHHRVDLEQLHERHHVLILDQQPTLRRQYVRHLGVGYAGRLGNQAI